MRINHYISPDEFDLWFSETHQPDIPSDEDEIEMDDDVDDVEYDRMNDRYE